MGAWSTTIMGGDTPLDIKSFIFDFLEIEQYPEDFHLPEGELTKEILETRQDDVFNFIENGGIIDPEQQHEAYLVLGYLMLQAGAKLNEQIQTVCVEAAEQDDWAQHSSERKKHIDAFKTAIQANLGVQIDLEEEGLFEAMFRKLSNNHNGLINENKEEHDEK